MATVAISVSAESLLNGKQMTCHKKSILALIFPDNYQLSEMDFTIYMSDGLDKVGDGMKIIYLFRQR